MKWVFRIAAALLVLLVLGVTAVFVFVDPNDYKPQIEQQVEEATGRKLHIGGDMAFSLLPLGLQLSEVELANADGFDDPYFARIDSLVVKVKLLPLLKKELAVDALVLDGFSLFLQIRADGVSNWQDLASAQSDTTAAQDEAVQTEAAAGSSASPLAALAVNGIELKDAQVQFNDQSTQQLVQLSKLNLTTGNIAFGQPFDLQFSVNAGHRAQQQQSAADIRLQTAITIEQSLQQFVLQNIRLNIKARAPEVYPDPVELTLRADSRIDLAQQRVELDNAEIEVMYLKLMLQAVIENWQQALSVSGSVRSDTIAPRELAQRFAIELPPMQAESALSALSFSSDFALRDNQLALQPLSIKLDGSTLNGKVTVKLSNTAIRYALTLDDINVDDYLPPPPPEAEAPAVKTASNETQAEPAPETDLPVPFDLLATLDVQGDFDIGRLAVAGHEITDFKTTTRIRNGVVTLDPVTLNVLEGSIVTSTVVDTRKRQLRINQTLRADKLQIASIANPIVATLIPDQQVDMRGTGGLYAEVRSSGLRISTLQQQLAGKAGFEFDDIVADGLDIEFLARGVIADYLQSKKLDVKPDWRGSYRPKNVEAFQIIKADFDIKRGVARTDNFIMDSKRIDVTAKGTVDIPQQTLDMYTITDLTPRQLKTTAEKLLDEPLPVHVYGPWAAPQVDVDTGPMKAVVARLAKAKVKARTEKKVETKKQQLRDKTRDKLKNKLQNLFR